MKHKKGKDVRSDSPQKSNPPPESPLSSPVNILEVEDDFREDDLINENQFLKAKLDEMARKLLEAEEINRELNQAKTMLSDEIVDLTKVLFEEANGMVANEVRARTQLEHSRKKLQNELESTKDRLRVESQQLSELKQKLYEIAADNSNVSLSSSVLGAARSKNESTTNFLLGQEDTRPVGYFDIFFPNRRFNSKSKCNGPNSGLWEDIIRSLDLNTFQSFSKFLEVMEKLDDDGVLGSPFVKRIYENDVTPCLTFDSKPKTFVKKMVQAMHKNTCVIERISASSPLPSPVQPTSPASQPSPTVPEPLDLSSPVMQPTAATALNTMMSDLALSFSSLPDVFVLDSSFKLTPAKSNSSGHFCALCGYCIALNQTEPLYRFKIKEAEMTMVIDEHCRNKLVAAAEFYTFLRHLKRGLYTNRPIIDLYYEVLHYLRNMFYARTAACSFFVQSDLEALCGS